jgi:adenylyl-sulfate kinase
MKREKRMRHDALQVVHALPARVVARQPGAVVWLTGLSGAGKSTLAYGAQRALRQTGRNAYVLDGDRLRSGLNRDLGFSLADRRENVRRVGEVAAMMAEAGSITLVALISPLRAGRDEARRLIPQAFHEVYVKASLAVCEARDPKGLYRRARMGEIAEFTGVSSPYEVPEAVELVVETERQSEEDAIRMVLRYIERCVLGC